VGLRQFNHAQQPLKDPNTSNGQYSTLGQFTSLYSTIVKCEHTSVQSNYATDPVPYLHGKEVAAQVNALKEGSL
jgi:hypothetical protein